MMNFKNSVEFALKLDEDDSLSSYRSKFFIPKKQYGEDVIYFAGHSLGLQPKSVKNYIEQELKDWAELGVEGHFKAQHPWLPYHEFLTEQTAHLVGAKPIEVVNMNTLTVNLHLMLVSFYNPSKDRHKILIESPAFPSDHYAVQSHIQFHGFDVSKSLIEISPKPGESYIKTEDIIELIEKEGESIALILFPGVNYYSGQAFEFEKITRAGHTKGCKVGFDLAHGTGNLVLNLHEWDVDFAVWCSYKYLNAGPGAVAGCFVHERYANDFNLPKFWGWWGHDKSTRFLMDKKFIPIPGAESWQLSNPSILQLASLRASLDIFDEAGMDKLRGKSELLTGYAEFLINNLNESISERSNGERSNGERSNGERSNGERSNGERSNGERSRTIEIITPENKSQRGCQLSLRIKDNGKKIHQKLIDNGVICDWREPDVIRITPVPLYNTFSDVWNFVEILKN